MSPEGRAAADGEDPPVGSQAGQHLQHVDVAQQVDQPDSDSSDVVQLQMRSRRANTLIYAYNQSSVL